MHRERLPFCPLFVISEVVRTPLIRAALPKFNADVICLQEVEAGRYEADYERLLAFYGYAGNYAPRRRGLDAAPEAAARVCGQATFAKRSKFAISGSKAVHFVLGACEHDECALLTALVGCGINLVVANVHLRYEPAAGAIREAQFSQTVDAALQFGRDVFGSNRFDALIAGDFNGCPGSKPGFSNAIGSDGPRFTEYDGVMRAIDWIVTTRRAIEPCGALSGYDPELVKRSYRSFPGQGVPSDHIPIGACFSLKPARLRVFPPEAAQSCGIKVEKPARGPPEIVKKRPE
jgi:mRNA deadenylase 3'-5' endonuclease subunit Ccr4